jgi:hypothetical protein
VVVADVEGVGSGVRVDVRIGASVGWRGVFMELELQADITHTTRRKTIALEMEWHRFIISPHIDLNASIRG